MTESADTAVLRHDWRADEVQALFALPFADLIYRAQSAHRAHTPGKLLIVSYK